MQTIILHIFMYSVTNLTYKYLIKEINDFFCIFLHILNVNFFNTNGRQRNKENVNALYY